MNYSRLQFIHFDGASNSITRQNAIDYIGRLTDPMVREDLRFDKSLIGEPIAVTYLDNNGNVQVMFGIGTKGENSGDAELQPYHIIDSAKLEEDIAALSGNTEDIRRALDEEIARAQAAEQALQDELDTTQTGAGLADNGNYVPNTAATYISSVDSLNNADVKLDKELARVEQARKDVTGQDTDVYVPNESLTSRPITYIEDAESLNDADVKLDQAIKALSDETLKNIIVNDVTGTVRDNIAEVTIDGDDIKIGEYDNYTGRTSTPHPIHDDYTVKEAVHQLDTNFLDFSQKEAEERKGIHLIKLTESDGLPVNVKEAYQLVDKNGNVMSGSARVDIYKDSSLYTVYLGHMDDNLDDHTSPVVTPGTGDTALCFIYLRMDGTYDLVKINVEKFLEESEFLDGLRVDNHKVYVKIDTNSEPFLTVSPNGVKLDGVQDAIDDSTNDEKERAEAAEAALQAELDATQTGAGLNTDGTYNRHNAQGESNYIHEATSLDGADVVLDRELKRVEDELGDEADRATAAENSISANVTTLSATVESFSSNTVNEVARLDTKIEDETDRATTAEESISADVTTLSTTVESFSASTVSEIARLSGGVTTEYERAKAAEDSISANVTTLSATVNDIQEELDTTQEGAGLNADGTYHRHNAQGESNYIHEATSLDGADLVLDRELKRVEDELDSEIDRATTAEESISGDVTTLSGKINDVQEELDRTQTGAGLNPDGTYKPHNTSPDDLAHYIDNATSLTNADFILDEKLYQLSGSAVSEIARLDERIDNAGSQADDIQAELDRTQEGAGLNADGTYSRVPSANYINEATSLKEADLILDTQLHDLSNLTESEVRRLDTRVDNEVQRAVEKENQISGDVTTLSATVGTFSAATDNKLNTEISRATAVENYISGSVTTLSASTFELSANTENRITEERNRAQGVEEELRDMIENATVFSSDNTVVVTTSTTVTGTDLAVNIDGTTIVKDANGVLTAKLKILKLATPSSTNVREEYALVDNNGTYLGDTVKVYKDTSLESVELVNIGGKEYLRFRYILADGSTSVVDLDVSQFLSETEFKDGLKVVDSNVYVLIDPTSEPFLTVSSNGVKLSGVQNAIDTAASTERTRAEAAEAELQRSISAETQARQTSDTNLQNAINTERDRAMNIESNLQNAINNEQDRATAAEVALNNALSAETQARQTADTNLQNAINTERDRAQSAETTLNTAIVTERERAVGVESELRGLISTETLARQNGDTTLTSNLNSEISRAQGAESTLNTAINNEITNRQTAISDEIANREAADDQLQANIDDVYTAYTHAITEESTSRIDTDERLERMIGNLSGSSQSIETRLQQEITRATAAETYISGNVTTLSSSTVEINNKVNTLSSSTHTIENNLTQLSGSVNTLSSTTNTINNNLTTLSSTTREIQTGLTALSGSVITLSSTTNTINNNLTTLSGSVTALSSTTVEIRNDVNELSGSVVSFSASTHTEITDIKDRLNNLSSKSVEGSQAIKVQAGTGATSGVSTVSLLINGSDKVLSQDNSGLFTTLSMELSNDSKTLTLKGKNGAVISTVDTTSLVKDGMLDSVTFDPDTKVLKFVFNTDSGKSQIDVPLGSLVDIYTVSAGSTTYLEIADYKVGARVDVDGGLASYAKIKQLSGDVVTLSGSVTALSATVVNIQTGLTQLSGEVITNKNNINTLSGNLITLSSTTKDIQSGLTQLSGSVVTISGDVNTISGNLITLSSTTKDIQSGLTQLSGSVVTISGDVNTISGNVVNLSAQTVSNTSEITELKQQVSALTQQVSALTQTINEIDDNIVQYLNNHLYDALKSILQGTTNKIGITADDTNKKLIIGFDPTLEILGTGDDY